MKYGTILQITYILLNYHFLNNRLICSGDTIVENPDFIGDRPI
jgi:hypothetical protein